MTFRARPDVDWPGQLLHTSLSALEENSLLRQVSHRPRWCSQLRIFTVQKICSTIRPRKPSEQRFPALNPRVFFCAFDAPAYQPASILSACACQSNVEYCSKLQQTSCGGEARCTKFMHVRFWYPAVPHLVSAVSEG